jgi:putative DNA methylase
LTFFYAFKQSEAEGDSALQPVTGWETMLQGLVDAGSVVDATWPVRTEQAGGLREVGRNALASSIVLVCRARAADAPTATRNSFLRELKRELPQALIGLRHGNIAPVDLAQAAIGPGMGVFSRYARVLESDGQPMRVRTALALINQVLAETLAEQEGEMDADTRWALTWFDENGFAEGPYGRAEVLATAKVTSMPGLVTAGIVSSARGKVRLLRREELATDWDPATDTRRTVWEATHHLSRTLESNGEAAAAVLLGRLGDDGERTRDLAYRLYTTCERRGWAQDAQAYNALVVAWPEIARQASAVDNQVGAPGQEDMFA